MANSDSTPAFVCVLGEFNPSFDVVYLDGSLECGLQQTRLFPGRFCKQNRDEVIRELKSAIIDTSDMESDDSNDLYQPQPISRGNNNQESPAISITDTDYDESGEDDWVSESPLGGTWENIDAVTTAWDDDHDDDDDEDIFLVEEGARVEARFRANGCEWYSGVVISCNPADGVADVVYENGRIDFGLPFNYIRKAESALSTIKQQPGNGQKLRPSSARMSRHIAAHHLSKRPRSAGHTRRSHLASGSMRAPTQPQYGHVNVIRNLRGDFDTSATPQTVQKRAIQQHRQRRQHRHQSKEQQQQLISNLVSSIGQIQNKLNSISSQLVYTGNGDGTGLASSPTQLSQTATSLVPTGTGSPMLIPSTRKESSADATHRMAQLAEHEGCPERAAALYHEAFVIKQRDLGAKHRSTVLSLSCYGRAMTASKGYEKAIQAQEQVIRIKEEVLGDAHISTALSRADLGMVYYRKGDNTRAVAEFRQSLRLSELAGRAQHVYMAMPLVFLGNALIRVGPQWNQEVGI